MFCQVRSYDPCQAGAVPTKRYSADGLARPRTIVIILNDSRVYIVGAAVEVDPGAISIHLFVDVRSPT